MQTVEIKFLDGTRRILDITARPDFHTPRFVSGFLHALRTNACHAPAGSPIAEVLFREHPDNQR